MAYGSEGKADLYPFMWIERLNVGVSVPHQLPCA